MSNNKRILIFSHAMEIGGAETALLGLLEAMDPSRVQVDLFLMRHQGDLLPHIPEWVNLLPEVPQYANLAVPILQVLKQGQVKVAVGRLMGKLAAKIITWKLKAGPDNQIALEYSHKFTLGCMPFIGNGEYDMAISFLTPHYFVAKRVKSKRKIAWIHTDYSYIEVDTASEVEMWDYYDSICSISPSVTEGFLSKFPSLKRKLVLVENILPASYIRHMAKAFDASMEMPRDGSVRLLTAGRFSPQKNLDNVPAICRRLRKMGLDVTWYLIGYGAEEGLIRERIEANGMEDRVVILGKKANPYPYLRECDLYVQPSRYEGKSIAVREAQLLGRPVVITSYPTADSQLRNGIDGIVVPMDNKGCAESIASLLSDKHVMKELRERCIADASRIASISEVEKIYQLIGAIQ